MDTPIYEGPARCADRLRILTDELRYFGAKRWILTALDFLADELEDAEYAVLESLPPQDEISDTQ